MDVLDGSTIESWMGCPFAAKAQETGVCKIMPEIVAVGSEIHDAYGEVVRLWCESGGAFSPAELKSELDHRLRQSRPDVQPQVLDAAGAASWTWVNFIRSIHPDNLIAFDGGEFMNRSGQLSMELDGVIITSEVDLLYSGPSPELLHEVDYKTGWKRHTADSVYTSGQFQRHAILVFNTFPAVNGLEVTVWDIRTNQRTYKVVFQRRHMQDYIDRVLVAVRNRQTYYDNPPTFPTFERCSICNAASICPVVDTPIRTIADNPVAFIRDMVAVQARLDAMFEIATKYADQFGTIDAGQVRFGRDAPKSTRKAPAKLYDVEDKDG